MQVRAESIWDESMSLADLKQQLLAAVDNEDYALAAAIRDTLQQKQTDSKLAVEDANARFYDAFRSGNIKSMEEIWGHGDHVQVVHPASNIIAGREAVMESWAQIMKGIRPRAFNISIQDVRVYATETHGTVTCTEIMDADESRGRCAATNLYEKQNGKWVIVHHHGSPARALTRQIQL